MKENPVFIQSMQGSTVVMTAVIFVFGWRDSSNIPAVVLVPVIASAKSSICSKSVGERLVALQYFLMALFHRSARSEVPLLVAGLPSPSAVSASVLLPLFERERAPMVRRVKTNQRLPLRSSWMNNATRPMFSLLETILLQKRVAHDYLSQGPIITLSLQPCRDDLPQIWGPIFQCYKDRFSIRQMACADTAKDVCDVQYR